jgi:hypothetical protein
VSDDDPAAYTRQLLDSISVPALVWLEKVDWGTPVEPDVKKLFSRVR